MLSVVIWQSEFEKPCGNFADSQLVPYSVLRCLLNYEIQAFHYLSTWPTAAMARMTPWGLVIVLGGSKTVQNHEATLKNHGTKHYDENTFKIVEQTITMKSHKAYLAQSRKRPKIKKNHETQ